jgi:hypothetical protein
MLLRLIHDALLAESVAIVIVQMTPIRLQMANAKSFGSFHATGLVILTVDTAMQSGRRSYKFATTTGQNSSIPLTSRINGALSQEAHTARSLLPLVDA